MSRLPELVALIPAAGHARRLPDIDHSKEILQVGTVSDGRGGTRPKAVCEYLLEALATAGIERGFMILRPAKDDVRAYLEALPQRLLELNYPLVGTSPSVPHTLDSAFRLAAGMRVALGFPDILIRPATAFAAVRQLQETSGADIVLGLFPTRHPERSDMVELDGAGRPSRLWIKRPDRGLMYTWSIAVWTPRFTEFLHRFVAQPPAEAPVDRELQIGDVVQAALEDGISAEAVAFPTGDSLDVGEPEALAAARQMLEDA